MVFFFLCGGKTSSTYTRADVYCDVSLIMLKPSCFNCQEIKMLLQNSPWLSVWRSGTPEDQAPHFCPLTQLMASYVVVFNHFNVYLLDFFASLSPPPSLSLCLSLFVSCLSVCPLPPCVYVYTHTCVHPWVRPYTYGSQRTDNLWGLVLSFNHAVSGDQT